VGKLADLVVLDHDITNIPPHQIRDARVNLTLVGGEIVFRNADL
jgi:predicted amidohydrolase YtcJ